ncbi:ATP-dependent Clp protease adapter protein ClpS [Paracoccus sp. J56]|nr:ATP-dependent Clp protease adapter protein ClpS [Paracoccus sp. J56]
MAQYAEPRSTFVQPFGRRGLSSRGKAFIFSGTTIRNSFASVVTNPHMTNRPGDREEVELGVKTRPRTQRPPMYKVLLLNDDFTPMEFVVHVLERLFNMSHAQAIEIMLTVHRKGVAVVGVFSHEIAETKVAQVMELARRQQHPLQCTMEKE